MKHHRLWPVLAVALLTLILTGCASPISRGLRQQARADLNFTTVLNNPDAFRGTLVIWGGIIQQMQNQSGGTSITVLAYPLDWRDQPQTWKAPEGRFLVLSSQFLDPAVYRRGRKLTVAGPVAGSQTRPLNDSQYRYPALTAQELYLWPHYRVVYFGYPYNYDYYAPYPYGPYPYAPYPYAPYPYGPYPYGPYSYDPYPFIGPSYGWYGAPFYYAPFGFRGGFHERGDFHGPEGGGHGGGRGH